MPIPTRLTDAVVVSYNVIMIDFGANVAADASLSNVNNYTVACLSGGSNGIVVEMRPLYTKNPRKVMFQIDNLVSGQTYQFNILANKIYTQAGVLLGDCYAVWTMHLTKVDSALNSLAGMYSKSLGSNIRALVETVAISDESIGGDY